MSVRYSGRNGFPVRRESVAVSRSSVGTRPVGDRSPVPGTGGQTGRPAGRRRRARPATRHCSVQGSGEQIPRLAPACSACHWLVSSLSSSSQRQGSGIVDPASVTHTRQRPDVFGIGPHRRATDRPRPAGAAGSARRSLPQWVAREAHHHLRPCPGRTRHKAVGGPRIAGTP